MWTEVAVNLDEFPEIEIDGCGYSFVSISGQIQCYLQ
jgi:hypothetical protein